MSEIKSLTQQFVLQGKCQPLLLSHVKQDVHPAALKVHFAETVVVCFGFVTFSFTTLLLLSSIFSSL